MNSLGKGRRCAGLLRSRVETCKLFGVLRGGGADLSGLEFRCLVTDDHREQIDAVAFLLNAQVSYFRGPMNVISISRNGEYLGCVWGKDFTSLEKSVLDVLNAN